MAFAIENLKTVIDSIKIFRENPDKLDAIESRIKKSIDKIF